MSFDATSDKAIGQKGLSPEGFANNDGPATSAFASIATERNVKVKKATKEPLPREGTRPTGRTSNGQQKGLKGQMGRKDTGRELPSLRGLPRNLQKRVFCRSCRSLENSVGVTHSWRYGPAFV